MKIGILGLGPVGKSFLETFSQYGNHNLFVYDANPKKVTASAEQPGIYLCNSEEEVGKNSDFLLGCVDMLSSYAITNAAKVMRQGAVVSGDFSAKTPEYKAVKASGRDDLSYWSIHTMFAPQLGFNGQLTLEIPVRNCYKDSIENPYITEFRKILTEAGSKTRTIWSFRDHDERMGRIQGSTSAENICTARTFAELGINPTQEKSNVYANEFDKTKFLMSLEER